MSKFHHILISFNLKIVFKIIVLTIIIATISACNTDTTQKSSNNVEDNLVTKKVFLIGGGANLKTPISDMIEKAGIRKGGYVVIIQASLATNNSNANSIKKQFNDQNIMAVHILKFDPESTIKNTDIITIGNASIICIIGDRPNKLMKLTKSTRLKKSLLKTYENGTLIAGIGSGATILGDYYFTPFNDTKSQEKKIALNPGLGILKNTVINEISLLKNHKKTIQKKSITKKFIFIGLGKTSSILVEDSVGTVISKSGINIIYPEKESEKLGIGDGFSLQAQ